jgi:hypothetical protein
MPSTNYRSASKRMLPKNTSTKSRRVSPTKEVIPPSIQG